MISFFGVTLLVYYMKLISGYTRFYISRYGEADLMTNDSI